MIQNHRHLKRRGLAALGLVGVWALTWAGSAWLGSLAIEPGDVVALVEGGAGVDAVAAAVNRLPNEAKFDRAMGDALRPWFEGLSEAEQAAYLDATLPAGFSELMDVVNAMSREERRALVGDALRDLDARLAEGFTEGDGPLPAVEERIVEAGMESYFKDASAEAKLDLQPLVRRMQAVLQSGGMRGSLGAPR